MKKTGINERPLIRVDHEHAELIDKLSFELWEKTHALHNRTTTLRFILETFFAERKKAEEGR